MDIHTAAHYMKCGYRITRPKLYVNCEQNWLDINFITFWPLHMEDLLATDWEIDFRDMTDDSGIKPIYKEPVSDEEE